MAVIATRSTPRGAPDALIPTIYDAALEPDRWRDVLRELAARVSGERPALFGHDVEQRAGAIRLAVDFGERDIREYADYYGARNVWLKHGAHLLKSGAVRVSHQMCSDGEFRRSEFYNDYLKPLGSTRAIGATIWHRGAQSYNLTIMRAESAPPFGDREIRTFRRVMPHLQRAIQIRRRLAEMEVRAQAKADALDRLPAGLILVDVQCRVVFSNRAARDIAGAADGVRVKDGKLIAELAAETKKLHALIANAAASRAHGSPAGGGVMTIARRSQAAPLSVLVTSLAIGTDFLVSDPPVAAVFVFDHGADGESVESVLTRLHALTAAEARVVARLLQGDTIESAADRLCISAHTARTHLKRALAKTGTNRQTELLRRVLTGPAGFRTASDPAR